MTILIDSDPTKPERSTGTLIFVQGRGGWLPRPMFHVAHSLQAGAGERNWRRKSPRETVFIEIFFAACSSNCILISTQGLETSSKYCSYPQSAILIFRIRRSVSRFSSSFFCHSRDHFPLRPTTNSTTTPLHPTKNSKPTQLCGYRFEALNPYKVDHQIGKVVSQRASW